MKNKFCFICFIFLLFSCGNESDNVSQFNTEEFINNTVEGKSNLIKEQISEYFLTNSNKTHKINFEQLISDLRNNADINICSQCYECVETNPAKSIIDLTIVKDGLHYSVEITIQNIDNTTRMLHIICNIKKDSNCIQL